MWCWQPAWPNKHNWRLYRSDGQRTSITCTCHNWTNPGFIGLPATSQGFKNLCYQLPNRIRSLFQTPVSSTIAANKHSIIEVKTVFLKSSSCLFTSGTRSIMQSVKPQRPQASQIKVFEMQMSINNYAFMRLPCKEPCTNVRSLQTHC